MPENDAAQMTNLASLSKVPIYWPETLDGPVTLKSVGFKVSQLSTNTHNSFSVHLGIYTYANSTSANLVGSGSDAFIVSSNSSASFSGPRIYVLTSPGTVAAISNLTPGNYVFGMMFSAGNTSSINMNIYGAGSSTGISVGRLGMIKPGTNQVSTGTSQGPIPLMGRGSTTVNNMPAAVSGADLINQGTGASAPLHPYLFIRS
jgi:hypothetical protein